MLLLWRLQKMLPVAPRQHPTVTTKTVHPTTAATIATVLKDTTQYSTANITMYTIAFNVNDADTVELLRQCASGDSRAFTIDNGDALIAVFEAIANEINRLRITS